MNWLSYFLTVSHFNGKKPYLVLIVRPGVCASSIQLDDVHAAVILFEYRAFGLPTGVFSTDDWAGFRSVAAPEAERGAMAAMAVDALLARGAQLVVISYGHATKAVTKLEPASSRAMRWGWQTRPVIMTLALEATFQSTLAKLGKATRFNLGYYRRRLAAHMPCEFIPDARSLLKEDELKSLNSKSLNPILLSDFQLQFRSACNLPGGFLLGLRSAEGKWLSLIGGWRQDGVTVLHWQMNTSGYEKLSLGTVMRSYFVEHEVERGTETLVFYGGTPHSMGNSFARESVTDLIVQRRSLRALALQAAFKVLTSRRSGIRINSFLAHALAKKDFDWCSWDEKRHESEPQAFEPNHLHEKYSSRP